MEEEGELADVPIEKELGEAVIEVDHISKVYNIAGRHEGVVALKDIVLSRHNEFYPVRRGEFVMLRGPSGGGKTSLLNILGTIDRASSGKVELLGSVVDEHSSDDFLAFLRLSKIGFVFQTFNLLATMSAFENVELPMTILGEPADKRAVRAKRLLKQLSGGEQQRVTIARALSNKPEILLLDEPTGDLDTKNTIEIMDLLLDINLQQRTTCVMVTHNPDIECYADRILYVSDGKFVGQALNYRQSRLVYEDYIVYLNSLEEHANRF